MFRSLPYFSVQFLATANLTTLDRTLNLGSGREGSKIAWRQLGFPWR